MKQWDQWDPVSVWTRGYSLHLCTKLEWQGGGEKRRPHLSGQQPPVLWEVQDGLHHLVGV